MLLVRSLDTSLCPGPYRLRNRDALPTLRPFLRRRLSSSILAYTAEGAIVEGEVTAQLAGYIADVDARADALPDLRSGGAGRVGHHDSGATAVGAVLVGGALARDEL